jgi:uncharacterized protein DUF1573
MDDGTTNGRLDTFDCCTGFIWTEVVVMRFLIILIPLATGVFIWAEMPRRPLDETTLEEHPLAVSPTHLDFGPLAEDAGPALTAVLTNHSRLSLSVIDVATTCGCTAPFLSRTEIEPGGSAKLIVTVHPSPSEKLIHGQVQMTYRLASSVAPQRLSIPVDARVEPEFTMEPQSIVFTEDESSQQEVCLVRGRDKSLELAGVEIRDGRFSCQIGGGQSGWQNGVLRILVNFRAAAGGSLERTTQLIVKTTNRLHPVETVAIHIRPHFRRGLSSTSGRSTPKINPLAQQN